MISKKPLYPQRVRKINGSFAFIEHRFLRKGFWYYLWKGLESGLINWLNPFGKHRVVRN